MTYEDKIGYLVNAREQMRVLRADEVEGHDDSDVDKVLRAAILNVEIAWSLLERREIRDALVVIEEQVGPLRYVP